MTLDGLESLLAQHFPRDGWRKGQRWSPMVNLIRYADDFIITGSSQELLEKEGRPLVEEFLKERGLVLSPEIWKRLDYPGDTRIRRHIRIRQTANPYDPAQRQYFEDRAFYKRFGYCPINLYRDLGFDPCFPTISPAIKATSSENSVAGNSSPACR